MVTKILTNLAVAKKRGIKGGVVYRSPRIYLPTKLTDDSSFPFLEGQEVVVKIAEGRLVIEASKRAHGPLRIRKRGGAGAGAKTGTRSRRVYRQSLKRIHRRTKA